MSTHFMLIAVGMITRTKGEEVIAGFSSMEALEAWSSANIRKVTENNPVSDLLECTVPGDGAIITFYSTKVWPVVINP